jgi:hypothetical protein
MQDPIQMTMLVLAIIVVVTFTVLSLVYPTEQAATDALSKRLSYQDAQYDVAVYDEDGNRHPGVYKMDILTDDEANALMNDDVNEYIVSYVPNCNQPEVRYLTDDMAAELAEHAYSVEKVGDPLSEICDKDEWDKNYPM